MQLQNIEERVEKIEKLSTSQNVNTVQSQQIQKMQNQLVQITDSVSKLENSVGQLQQKVATIDKVQASLEQLSKRVEKVESVNGSNNNAISDLTKKLATVEKNVTTVQSRVASLENQIKQIDNLQKGIDSLSAQVRNIQQNMPQKISQSDIEFLKQLQQQIIELKSALQSTDPATLLKLNTGYIYYIVKSGDNLSSIASAYKVSLNSLISINDIKDASKISVGQLIKIPVDDPKNYVRVPVKIQPTDILSYHGQERNGVKTIGMDIYAKGKDIYPILPGKVLNVDNTTVTIDHGNMIMAIYGGINTSLKPGNFVSVDKPIGQCIDVFHFELYIDGEPRDPLRLFTEYKGIFTVTFYSEWDDGKVPIHPTFRIARNGRVPQQFLTIAVDPTVIPLGSLVYIPTLANVVFIAEDTGSAIKGNRIDVYVSDVRLALNNGITPHPVYIIRPEINN
ncbi:3D domain-containing protein [Fervidobacterium islandicum]|uniref:3D domain-containing protein n=1 Tax=Fervidobacterium islandicum TaxID=2423 RepID=UPI000A8D5684|nr:3D domain-containing protein [Fervidobacterium islandicum]